MKNTVHYKKGMENKIAFVFSCPGQLEQNANPPGPVQGATGDNLNVVIEFLSKKDKTKGITRESATITNAWDKVEYKKSTGRSEATIGEVMQSSNLERLAAELETIEQYIFASGVNAQAAVMALRFAGRIKEDVKVITLRHLGNQSVNQDNFDIDGNIIESASRIMEKPLGDNRSLNQIKQEKSKANRKKRLEKVAFELYKDICTSQ